MAQKVTNTSFPNVTYIGEVPQTIPNDPVTYSHWVEGSLFDFMVYSEVEGLFGLRRAFRPFALFGYLKDLFYRLRRLFGRRLVSSIGVDEALEKVASALDLKPFDEEEGVAILDTLSELKRLQGVLEGCHRILNQVQIP